MAITLALTRVLGKLFSYIKQPQVIGEIVAGIFLGPSVLGRIPGKLPGASRLGLGACICWQPQVSDRNQDT